MLANPQTPEQGDWLDSVFDKAVWGDYQDESGKWCRGITNRPELRTTIEARIDSAIGEDETHIEPFTEEGMFNDIRNTLRAEIRQALFLPTTKLYSEREVNNMLDKLAQDIESHVMELNPAEDDRNGTDYTEEYFSADDVRELITKYRITSRAKGED